MSDFAAYMLAQSEQRAAFQAYCYAGAKLENAQIKERLAQIKSQHEPLAGLMDEAMSERDRLHAAAFYVVVGRMPEPQKKEKAI
jgi:hypothetical protein